MNNTQQKNELKVLSLQTLQKRKRLLVYPILVVPFLTLAFWALGGGKEASGNGDNNTSTGLNLQLPDAHFTEDSTANKLSLYDEADRNTPRLGRTGESLSFPFESATDPGGTASKTLPDPYDPTPPISTMMNRDPNEEKVYQKLSELNRQLHNATTNTSSHPPSSSIKSAATSGTTDVGPSSLVNVLQTNTENGKNSDDPEMAQLNATLEKILDIQHPERIISKLEEKSKKQPGEVFVVRVKSSGSPVSLLDTAKIKMNQGEGFYSTEKGESTMEENTIEAFVPDRQTITDGALLRLRVRQDISVDGALIPKGTLVVGRVNLDEERLQIEIRSIRCNNAIYPVQLEVYDLDGLPGIYIPGTVTRDVAKQSADQSLQLLQLSALDPTIKAQVASAGISAAKTLLSKKAKGVKVTVKGGYQVLLKNKSGL